MLVLALCLVSSVIGWEERLWSNLFCMSSEMLTLKITCCCCCCCCSCSCCCCCYTPRWELL